MRRGIRHTVLAIAMITLGGCLGGAARREAMVEREIVAGLVRERDSVWVRMQALEHRIAQLTALADSLRRDGVRLEETLRARDDQLSAARLELQRLKEIDLKSPRKPPGSGARPPA